MSRQNASKSRAEKAASRGGGGAQSVPVPVVTNDVIPGRFTDSDWGRLMSDEDNVEFVGSLVDEIINKAQDDCDKTYTWKQVLPFTAHQAKEALLQIVEWRFLSRDFGENSVSSSEGWKEDSEPEAPVIDSWAQGSVPVVVRPQSSSLPSVSMISEEHAYLPEPTATTLSDDQTDSSGKSGENKTEQTNTIKEEDEKDLKSSLEEFIPEPPKVKSKRGSYKRHTGRVLPPIITNHSENKPEHQETAVLDKTAHLTSSQKTLLKVQAGRPPGNREVTFDDRGNVVGVMKLNAKTLPTHRVRVQYSIIDPEVEANAQRLVAMRTGRIHRTKQPSWKTMDDSSESRPTFSLKSSLTKHTSPQQKISMSIQHIPPGSQAIHRIRRKQGTSETTGRTIDPLPPSLIDTIDASPGVIIHESGQTKAGPEEKFPVGIFAKRNQNKPSLKLLGSIRKRPLIHPKDIVGNVHSGLTPHSSFNSPQMTSQH